MSNPENPLNFYRTYAYHHVLIATNSTGVLDEMSKPEFPFSLLLRGQSGRSADEIELHTIDNAGDYVVIFNGMQDTDFFIRDMTWESVMVPRTGSSDNYTTMGLEGEMTVVEPQGARFFRYLNDVFDKLQTDPVGITFILKTIFVGHPDGDLIVQNSGSLPQQVGNVKPLGFTLYDIESDFDAAGSEYRLQFVGTVNGAAKLPQITNGVDSGMQSVKAFKPKGESSAPDTLENVMNNFTTIINDRYEKFTTDYIEERGGDEKCFRKVKYTIILDKIYQDAKYLVDDISERAGENADEGIIAFGPSMSVEQCINKLMKSSKRVLKDATEAVDAQGRKSKYIYKIHSTIKSTVSGPNEGIFEIVYNVLRYEVKVVDSGEVIQGNATSELTEPGNVLELDYVFTGANVDVMEFNMKMDTGLLFLMTLQPSSNLTDGSSSVDNKNEDNKKLTPGTNQNANYVKRCNTPLFPPQTPTDQETLHSTSTLDKTNFRTLLNKHAMLAALDATIKIRGNPTLLNDLIVPPGDLANAAVSRTDPESIMGDWRRTPGLIKLNIRIPTSGENENNLNFSEPFWYQGHYQVISVKNIFSEGEFTQDIEMIAMPQDDEIPALQTKGQKKDQKEEARKTSEERTL